MVRIQVPGAANTLPPAGEGDGHGPRLVRRYGRLPTSPPTPSPSASATHEPDDQQQYQRADGGVDDRRNNARAKMDAELRKQPTTDERTNNSNDEIADDPKSGALHDLAGQPSGNDNDIQPHGSSFFGNRGRIDAVAHAADQTATFGQSGGMASVGRPLRYIKIFSISLWTASFCKSILKKIRFGSLQTSIRRHPVVSGRPNGESARARLYSW